MEPKPVILVTGEIDVSKNFCSARLTSSREKAAVAEVPYLLNGAPRRFLI